MSIGHKPRFALRGSQNKKRCFPRSAASRDPRILLPVWRGPGPQVRAGSTFRPSRPRRRSLRMCGRAGPHAMLVLSGGGRFPVFFLSVAATAMLCSDPAAGGASTDLGARVSRAIYTPRLRGGAPDGSGFWHAELPPRVARTQRMAPPPPLNENAWPAAVGPGPDGSLTQPYHAEVDVGGLASMLGGPRWMFDGQSNWVDDLLSEDPAVAKLAGDLANAGRGSDGLFFASHVAFAAAAKTVAFLAGSAARAPRERTWRKVRARNPALWQRLGRDGFKLLESCGYVRHKPPGAKRGDAFYMLEQVDRRRLEAMEHLLLAAADNGREWIREQYAQWLRGRGGANVASPSGWEGWGDRGGGFPHSYLRGETRAFDGVKVSGDWVAARSGAGRDGAEGVYGRGFVASHTRALAGVRRRVVEAQAKVSGGEDARGAVASAGVARGQDVSDASTYQDDQSQNHDQTRPAGASAGAGVGRGVPAPAAHTATQTLLETAHRALMAVVASATGMARVLEGGRLRGGEGAAAVAAVLKKSGQGVRDAEECIRRTLASIAAAKQAGAREAEAVRAMGGASAEVQRSDALHAAAQGRCRDLEASLAARSQALDQLYLRVRQDLDAAGDGDQDASVVPVGAGLSQQLSRATEAGEHAKRDLMAARRHEVEAAEARARAAAAAADLQSLGEEASAAAATAELDLVNCRDDALCLAGETLQLVDQLLALLRGSPPPVHPLTGPAVMDAAAVERAGANTAVGGGGQDGGQGRGAGGIGGQGASRLDRMDAVIGQMLEAVKALQRQVCMHFL